jgi:uncharacterized protein (TIGR02145 family)
MSIISRWFKPSVKQLKKKRDVDGLAKEFQDRLKTNSLLDLQETILIIKHLNALSDSRGIEFLPDVFKALFLCKKATPADWLRLGLSMLQYVGKTGDASRIAAINSIRTSLDTMLAFFVEVESVAPTATQIPAFAFTQKKAAIKYLLKEVTTRLSNDSFVDPRDGAVYKTIKIGNQVWMAENLNFETENGTKKILGVFSKIVRTSWCNENNGRLYTCEAARNACPPGWHLPTKEEWEILYMFLGGNGGRVYDAVKEGGSCGFNALLAGMCYNDGTIYDIGNIAFFWSSTDYINADAWKIECIDADAWNFQCCSYPRTATISHSDRKCGYNVRLLRN